MKKKPTEYFIKQIFSKPLAMHTLTTKNAELPACTQIHCLHVSFKQTAIIY